VAGEAVAVEMEVDVDVEVDLVALRERSLALGGRSAQASAPRMASAARQRG
jgi:hypothetical protein